MGLHIYETRFFPQRPHDVWSVVGPSICGHQRRRIRAANQTLEACLPLPFIVDDLPVAKVECEVSANVTDHELANGSRLVEHEWRREHADAKHLLRWERGDRPAAARRERERGGRNTKDARWTT
jgi:hypothetical protein